MRASACMLRHSVVPDSLRPRGQVHSWGKFCIQKIQRDQKTQLPLLSSLEQKQSVRSKSRALHLPPALNSTREVGRPLGHPSSPTNSWTHPYPHPICGTSSPYLRQQVENLLFALAPLCCSRRPNKAAPAFPVGPLVNSY